MTHKTCFVIGPIGPENSEIRQHADWLLEGIITPVLSEFGFQSVRADKITTPGMIDSQVINLVIEAPLVIADLSEWNANAFYELGLRHMAEKPVIHMIDRAKPDIPFDVKPYRTILFGWTTPKELEQSKEDLRSQVRTVVDESHSVDNPVIRARGQMKLRETASTTEQEFLSMIEDLQSRLARVERSTTSPDLAAAYPGAGTLNLSNMYPGARASAVFSGLTTRTKADLGPATRVPNKEQE
jgi:hypothetical protein